MRPATAGCHNRRLGFDIDGLTALNIVGDNTSDLTFLIFHQVNGVPLIQKSSTTF